MSRDPSDEAEDLFMDVDIPDDQDLVATAASSHSAKRRKGDMHEAGRFPSQMLVELAWKALAKPKALRRFPLPEDTALVICVPDPTWIGPLSHFLGETDGRISIFEAKAGKKISDEQARSFLSAIAAAMPVISIVTDLDSQLPSVMRGASDTVLTVPTPSLDLIRRAITRWTGRSAPPMTTEDVAGLSFVELVAALRPMTTPAACVKRLKRASTGKSTVRIDDKTPLLQDLFGYDAAKTWCLDLAEDLALIREGKVAAGELESCVFYGPPGTGKTTLAKSLARSTRLPLIATSVGAWFSGKDGALDDVIRQINDVFDRALSSAPSILFLDELDSLPDRQKMDNRGRSWWTPVVTHMLLRIDSARASQRGVVLLAATNHLENIDRALLRPGRFDRQIEIEPPDDYGLAGIMRGHLGQDCEGADLLPLARLMHGSTGADVTAAVKAARRLARQAKRDVTCDDLRSVILPTDLRSSETIKGVAIHEAGHVVVASALGFRVGSASIIRNDRAEGWTEFTIKSVPDRTEIEAKATVLLAGRAADVVLGAGPNAGAVADLAEATAMLAAARFSYGLLDDLVVRATPDRAIEVLALDPRLAAAVDADLRRLLERATSIVTDHRLTVLRIAERLIAQRTIDADTINCVVGRIAGSRRLGESKTRSGADAL